MHLAAWGLKTSVTLHLACRYRTRPSYVLGAQHSFVLFVKGDYFVLLAFAWNLFISQPRGPQCPSGTMHPLYAPGEVLDCLVRCSSAFRTLGVQSSFSGCITPTGIKCSPCMLLVLSMAPCCWAFSSCVILLAEGYLLDVLARRISLPRSLGTQSSSQAALCAAVSNAARVLVCSWCSARRRVAGHLAAV